MVGDLNYFLGRFHKDHNFKAIPSWSQMCIIGLSQSVVVLTNTKIITLDAKYMYEISGGGSLFQFMSV